MKRKIAVAVCACMLTACAAAGVAGCTSSDPYSQSGERENEYFYSEELFHDQSDMFMEPLQPTSQDNVTIRLKVRRGLAQEAKIKYSFDLGLGDEVTFYTAPMVFERADDALGYDYWIGIIPANTKYYRYHFELSNKMETIWFDGNGVDDTAPTDVSGDWYVLPNFHVPEWSQGATWYSVMPDSFYSGNTLNDKTGLGVEDVWGSSVHGGMTGYFGGDLLGLLTQMDYLHGLNITSLFINPIWVTAHNAGYGQYDFYQIDSAYGNDELFFEFVNALHDDELKILCDAVIQYVNINNIIYNFTNMYPDLYGDKYDDAVQYLPDGRPSDSGWGGPMVDFSQKIARKYFYSGDQSVLISYILKYAIDGWRMDVGNTLSGSDPNSFGDSSAILADIRKYIKAAGDDLLFLSEHANAGQLTEGILDSKWNYAFTEAVQQWVTGISNANVLAGSLKSAVIDYPRPVANAMYNHLTSHDTRRMYDIVGQDDVKFAAAQLLQFTYVGSPVVYYGEEIGLSRPLTDGIERENSFDVAMNWDKATWNYKIVNFDAALAQLRKDYENTYRFGSFANLYSAGRNNPDDIFAFARFDRENACITLMNKNDTVVRGFELDVGLLSLADGTVLTDYFTGRQYTVNGGKVTADIYPAGSVLVTGKEGAWRDTMYVYPFGEGSVVTDDVGVYTFKGNGSLAAADSAAFAGAKAFNNCAVEADLGALDGKLLIAIRDTEAADSPFYGVVLENGTATLTVRRSAGAQAETLSSYSLGSAKTVRIERQDNNSFRFLLGNGAQLDEVALFRQTLPFDYEVVAGAAALSGSAKLSLRFPEVAEQTSADYEDGLGSLALVKGDASAVSVADDKLTIAGGEEDSFVVTAAHYRDFTERAEISYLPGTDGSFGGLTVMQSEKDYLLAGRYSDGTNVYLVVGQVIDGKLCLYSRQADVAGERIFLQFQRSGSTYTALVSADGETYRKFGEVSANYSVMYAGIVRSGADALSAESWCFGNGSKGTLAAHIFEGEVDFTVKSGDPTISYSTKGGSWSYVQGGIAQTSVTASSTLYNLSSKTVSDFRATFSLKVTQFASGGYVGAVFGRKTVNGTEGISLRIAEDGKATLLSADGAVLAEGNTSLEANELLQFTLISRGETIALYEGNDPKLVLSWYGTLERDGWFAWMGSHAAYELYSYNVYVPTGNLFVASGEAVVQESVLGEGYTDLELTTSNAFNHAVMKDIGIGGFALSFNLQMTRINTVYRGYADFSFGVSAGAPHLTSGVTVRLNDRGRLSVYSDGVQIEKDRETALTDTTTCFLVFVYRGKTLTVLYAAYEKGKTEYTPSDLHELYTMEDPVLHSGCFAFSSRNAGVRFNALRAYGISDSDDYTTLDLYTDIQMGEPLPGDPEVGTGYGENYRNDFDGNSSLETILKYSGACTVRDGLFTVNGFAPQNWDAGAAIATGIYKNFELTTRVKVVENVTNGGFVGVEIYKSSPTNNHQASALSVLLYPGGTVKLFAGNGHVIETCYANGTADGDGFYTLHIRAEDGTLSFDLGGEAASVNIAELPNNSNLREGYISLNAGSNTGVFDYVEIKVL